MMTKSKIPNHIRARGSIFGKCQNHVTSILVFSLNWGLEVVILVNVFWEVPKAQIPKSSEDLENLLEDPRAGWAVQKGDVPWWRRLLAALMRLNYAAPLRPHGTESYVAHAMALASKAVGSSAYIQVR